MNQGTKKEILERTTERKSFTIISPVLDPSEESEWVLSDGGEVFTAIITDENFLDSVQAGEVGFSAGTTLLAELETTHWMTDVGVLSEYRIREVLKVETPGT